MPDSNHVDIARRYANAYAAFDTAELRDVLAPDLRFRQVNPGGYLEVDTARAYIDGAQAFLDGYDAHAAITATAEQLGDLVLTTASRRDTSDDRHVSSHGDRAGATPDGAGPRVLRTKARTRPRADHTRASAPVSAQCFPRARHIVPPARKR